MGWINDIVKRLTDHKNNDVHTAAQPPQAHDNTKHSTAYEPANANIQAHIPAAAPHNGHASKSALFATVSDVTGSRAVNTVYQNTSGTPMKLNVMVEESGQGDYSLDIGASNPPTTQIRDRMRSNSDGYYTLYPAIVPSGFYYRLNQIVSGGNFSILSWIEQTGG